MDGEGEGSDATNPDATTPCSTDAKACMVAYDRPSTPSPVTGGGTLGYPLPTRATHLTDTMARAGGWVC